MEENSIVKYESGIIKRISNQIGVTNKLLALPEPLLIPYRKGNRWGFCTVDKKIIIQPKYGNASFFSDDIACVSLLTDYSNIYMYGCINKRGETIVPHDYFGTRPFYKGLVRARQKNFKWGLIDLQGNEVLEFLYDEIEDISDGYARVIIDKKFGLIDTHGKLIIKPIYGSIQKWMQGKFAVTLGDFFGQAGIIDDEENVIIPLIYNLVSFYDKFYLAIVSTNEGAKIVYLDRNGNNISQLEYDSLGSFFEGLASIYIDGKVGFINDFGNIVIPPTFTPDENIDYDCGGYEFSDGIASAKLNGRWGYIDKSGNCKIQFIFELAYKFIKGLARVKLHGKYGCIDIAGNIIIPCIYDMMENFVEGLARIKLNNRYGYINKEGRVIVSCDYDSASINFTNGFLAVSLNGNEGMLDYFGNTILPCIYDEIHPFSENMARVKLKGKYGYIDKKGNTAIPFIYSKAEDFRNGLAKVSIHSTNRTGFINKEGVEYWEY